VIPLHASHALHIWPELTPSARDRDLSLEPPEGGTLLLAAVLAARSRHPRIDRLLSLVGDVFYAELMVFRPVMTA
jgi:hypothetical protein